MSFVLHVNQLEQIFPNLKEKVNTSQEETISDELRGYNWKDLIVPNYHQLDLPFNQIAYQYCDSGRYLYLNQVSKIAETDNLQRARGKFLDSSIMQIIKNTVNHLKTVSNPQRLNIHSFLQSQKQDRMSKNKTRLNALTFLTGTQRDEILKLCEKLIDFEIALITTRIQYQISRINSSDMNSIIAHALPILIDDVLSVRDMGFSPKMTPDFIFTEDTVVGEFKGFKRDINDKAYRIAVTGYALAYEKTYHKKVDVGCVLFLNLEQTNETPVYEIDAFVTSDELRKAFIVKRETMTNIVYKKIEPNLATKCPQSCAYLNVCNPGEDKIDKSK